MPKTQYLENKKLRYKQLMKNHKISSLIMLISLFWAFPSHAQSAAINNGLTWLSANQNTDGSWGTRLELILLDTTETINAFKYSNNIGVDYTEGINWLSSRDATSTDELSRKIISLADAGADTNTLISALIGYKKADGGWGLSVGFENDPLTTALSLLALKAANYTDQSVISTALGYLISTQNPDGGWGFYPSTCSGCNDGDDSNVYMTAMVTNTLLQYKASYNLQSSINNGVSYLLTRQNTDGGFGAGSSAVYETSMVYQVLVRTIYDPIAWAKAESYLLTTQSPDGSWSQNPYSTALSLRALYDAERIRSSQIQGIDLYKSVNNQLQLSTTYDAYNRMVIKVNINDANVIFDIQIKDSSGNI